MDQAASMAWIREHWREYLGQWVFVFRGALVDTANKLEDVDLSRFHPDVVGHYCSEMDGLPNADGLSMVWSQWDLELRQLVGAYGQLSMFEMMRRLKAYEHDRAKTAAWRLGSQAMELRPGASVAAMEGDAMFLIVRAPDARDSWESWLSAMVAGLSEMIKAKTWPVEADE